MFILVFAFQEGAELLGDEKLGESRSVSKQKAKKTPASTKRVTSVDKVVEEAKKAFGSLDTSEGRTLRKRPGASSPAKPSLKKAGTMQKTAKVRNLTHCHFLYNVMVFLKFVVLYYLVYMCYL